jgi:hypothetical protein
MALETKGLYLVADRTGGVSIATLNPDGSKKETDEHISTQDLINVFLMNTQKDWQGRTKAAKLLGNRREAATPPALLNCMGTDPNLWVRRAALQSFQGLTGFGFQGEDIFAFREALDWWKKNQDTYVKSLPK